jgi:hypothetical protein
MKVIPLYNRKADVADNKGVTTQPTNITRTGFFLIALAPFPRPTPTTAPTIAVEVETGIPRIEKRWIPKADAT